MAAKNHARGSARKVIPSLIAVMLMLAGCGGGSGGIGGGATSSVKHAVHGVMHGGQNPVAGATVTLYLAGATGYGSSPSVLASAITDSKGNWNIASFSCPIGLPPKTRGMHARQPEPAQKVDPLQPTSSR